MTRINSFTIFTIVFIVVSFFYAKRIECYEVSKSDTLSVSPDKKSKSDAGSILIKGSDINIYVQEINEPIKIDGKLDDPAWEHAIPYNEYFFQLEPLDRAPSSEKTELRVLQDEHNIYFGAQCYDSEPEKIYVSEKREDGSFLNDDAFELLLDTFQDKRNCYAMGTNPFGVRVDAIISDEGNHINKSWDCIWYCKASVNDKGWAVEMAIPFKSLKYKKGEQVDWGLNISREIKHRQEETYLVPVPRGLGHNGKFKGSLFANLKNIKPPSYKLNLEVQPYTTAGRTHIYRPDDFDSELGSGFDIRYHVTPQLTLDLTYKTDFAHVESEQEIINVTRFNIRLPEKREFFLESAGLFQFGSGRSGSDFMLFNSRTIGIRKGQRIPLFGGAKITGRIGKYSIGALNIQSEKTVLNDGTVEPTTNFTAIKLKRDIYTNSNIGLMILNKQSSSNAYSRAIGGDAYFAFTQEFIVNGSIAKSFLPENLSKNWAGDFGIVLNKDWVDISLRYTHIDTLFNPEMGFIRRGNIRSTDGSVTFTKWINNDYFKSMSLANRISYITDNHNALQTRQNSAELSITARSGDSFSFEVNRDYDFLPYSQQIRDIVMDPGVYNITFQNISFSSYRSRPITGSILYRWGDWLDGKGKRISLSNNTKISNDLLMNLSYTYDWMNLKNGSLKAGVLSSRWTYSFSTEVFAKCYVQWNDADHKIAMNFLIDYIYRPRSHIYFVYNENRDTLINSVKNIKDRIILLKFTYLWSL